MSSDRSDTKCYTCGQTGKSPVGWAGNPSLDGITCPDCRGTGVDRTRFGTGMDCCPHCCADWKQPHLEECIAAGL